MTKWSRWTPEREELLREFYPNVPTQAIADALEYSACRVYKKANSLGLKKSDAFLASPQSGRVQRGMQSPQMIANQFKLGLIPWNKGSHFASGGRSNDTRFKAGNKPHTTMPIGSYRIVTEKPGRKHIERKISDAKGSKYKRWRPVTRLVWEAANGPVPDGHIVVFRPGMHTLVVEQITLDRVDCITLKENAARNHPNRSNPELGKLIQLKSAITRQVNRIQKESQI